MSTCEKETPFLPLDLPHEFEDLEGLLHADLQAIVAMVTERAHERLFLTRREHRQLQKALWNRMVGSIRKSVEPLRIENR